MKLAIATALRCRCNIVVFVCFRCGRRGRLSHASAVAGMALSMCPFVTIICRVVLRMPLVAGTAADTVCCCVCHFLVYSCLSMSSCSMS